MTPYKKYRIIGTGGIETLFDIINLANDLSGGKLTAVRGIISGVVILTVTGRHNKKEPIIVETDSESWRLQRGDTISVTWSC